MEASDSHAKKTDGIEALEEIFPYPNNTNQNIFWSEN
jgi:hypothetical protein